MPIAEQRQSTLHNAWRHAVFTTARRLNSRKIIRSFAVEPVRGLTAPSLKYSRGQFAFPLIAPVLGLRRGHFLRGRRKQRRRLLRLRPPARKLSRRKRERFTQKQWDERRAARYKKRRRRRFRRKLRRALFRRGHVKFHWRRRFRLFNKWFS